MISLNVTNFITIGIIAVVSYALVKWGANFAGVNVSWL
jgi:hypothetical protein